MKMVKYMETELFFDSAEPADIKNELLSRGWKSGGAMDHGDYKIIHYTDEGDKVHVLERKEMGDHFGGLLNNEYNERIAGLLKHRDQGHFVYWLLEGSFDKIGYLGASHNKHDVTQHSRFHGSLRALTFSHYIPILHTPSKSNTIEALTDMQWKTHPDAINEYLVPPVDKGQNMRIKILLLVKRVGPKIAQRVITGLNIIDARDLWKRSIEDFNSINGIGWGTAEKIYEELRS